jgi:hypothetical protein
VDAASLTGARLSPAPWALVRERGRRMALPAILLVGGLNFFWQLGSSSYFVDEAYSVMHSLPSLHLLFHLVNTTETTPYTYFLFLHQWLYWTGSQAEWVTRFPSAVAGVMLVAAVYWMATPFVGRGGALGAAGLAALSPLIQSYAQETRVYIFLLLVATLAVGATVRAVQDSDRRVLWLTLGAAGMFLSIWLHYIAVSVILPLAAWVATRRELTRRQRAGFVGACGLGLATVMPLLLEQYSIYPNGGAIAGAINWSNLVSVAGTPFGTRMGTPVDVRSVAAALLVMVALAAVAASGRRRVRDRGLLVALGIVGILGPFVLDLAGKHILITRYTVITAPFLVTVIAGAVAALPRSAAAALAAAAVAVSVAGLVDNHSRSGFYPPARQAIAYIAPREQPGEFMLSPGPPLTDIPILYYDIHLLRPKLHFFGLTDPRVPAAFGLYGRIWIIDNPASATPAAALAAVAPLLERYRFRAEDIRTFTTSLTLGVMLALRSQAPHPQDGLPLGQPVVAPKLRLLLAAALLGGGGGQRGNRCRAAGVIEGHHGEVCGGGVGHLPRAHVL